MCFARLRTKMKPQHLSLMLMAVLSTELNAGQVMVESFSTNMEDKILHSCGQSHEYINRVAAAEFCCDRGKYLQ